MIILGVDPGIERVGWGVVETISGNSRYVSCGRITTPSSLKHEGRLKVIASELNRVVDSFQPSCAVVEKIFFAKNKKTALSVSEARGAIMLTLAGRGIRIEERTPLEVKMALVGHGRAEKDQVAWVVKNLLRVENLGAGDDAYDALALCLMLPR